MQEQSIFTRIVNGEVPAYKIYEDERVIAILDRHPIQPGHTLVIPKKQIDHIWDLDQEDYEYLWRVAKDIAVHIKSVLAPPRVGVIVEGFGVPHTHIHLIPISHSDDIRVEPDRTLAPDDEALAEMANRLTVR
jgi:histidine triad (HIT) family protein